MIHALETTPFQIFDGEFDTCRNMHIGKNQSPSLQSYWTLFPASALRFRSTMDTALRTCQPTCCKRNAIILAPTLMSVAINQEENSFTQIGRALAAM